MAQSTTVTIGAARLHFDDIDALARQSAVAQIAGDVDGRIERSYRFVQELAGGQTPVYGLTTGCGPLAAHAIPAEQREAFQRNLIRSHAVTLGAPLPVIFVRAAMAVRAHVLAQGYSGVDPATVKLLVGMLNAGIHPLVREVGSVGASGDLVELAQIALAVIGEGEVEFRGVTVSAAAALREVRLNPLVPRYREGLALINGTSCHTGAAAVLLARARRVATAAQIAAAMIFDALRGNLEAFSPHVQTTRPHRGQRAVADRLVQLLAGSTLVRTNYAAAGMQDAYTLRCVPQVMGAVVDALDSAAAVVDIELNSVIDNPLFLVDEGHVVHGGNFHGQPVAMAIDQMKIAVVEIGVMAERRIARVLDSTLNADLPSFLIRKGVGVQSGFMGLQYCASSMAADNAVLAAPASVRSIPTNANNQDVVSMGMVAARQAARVLDNVERIVAIELLCAAQALDLRGVAHAGTLTRSAQALIRTHAAALVEDRPLAHDVEATCRLIDSGALEQVVS